MRVTPLYLLQRSSPLLLAATVLAGCASAPSTPAETAAGAQHTTITPIQKFMWFFSPYRPTVQQGNFVSREMLEQLKVGMNKEQVQFVLGTPLLMDPFHGQRWDYSFRLAKGNGELTTAKVVVYFDQDGKVARFEGGDLPSEREYIERIAGPIKEFKRTEAAQGNAAPARPPLPGGPESGQKQ